MGHLEKTGGLLDWAQRIKSLPDLVQAFLLLLPFIGAGWGLLVSIVDDLPLWASAMTGTSMTLLFSCIWIVWKKAWAFRGVKQLDIPLLGKDCSELSAAMLEYLASRHEMTPPMPMMANTSAALMAEISNSRRHSEQTRSRLTEKFIPRILAVNQKLLCAGIKPADLWGFDHNAGKIAGYIGAVGRLLEDGLLDEARKLNLEDQHFFLPY